MNICTACGAENITGRKFCGGCGSPLVRACPACAASNEPGVRFCGECGSPLDGAAAPVALPAIPTAERRLVSVLFADLVGFTTLSEHRDPEEVRELLSRYFEVAGTVIGRYGGTIEKFIGDAVMAVWGTPVAREDDAERAVRAALDLVDVVTELGERTGAELGVRAGVATGDAAVTLGAEGQGMVAGDLVNTASRIQSAAASGTVLVNDATRRASSAAISYEDAGTHDLKGKSEAVPLAQALRVTAVRGGALRAAGLEPPFVGRDREFRLVKELFHDAVDGRASRLLTVVGIAGIGKSRLAWEFEKYLDGLVDNAWWHRGRCLAYGEGVAYWALAEMIRMRARIADDDPADEALAKLHDVLAATIADESERAWIGPRLAHLIALGDAESFERQDLFSAWRLFFERLTDQAPVVLVFEDLQWADASLLDFVEHLLDWSRSYPIFVLALTRPELAERRSLATGRSSTTLSLDPLSESAMRDLMERFVPGLPGELTAQILERSQGVPLYAVETVRMLLDRGVLTADADGYTLTGEVGALEVPETLHALIAARIDDLSAEERAVVQNASVLGKSFTPAGLTALAGRRVDELDRHLTSLVRKEFFSVQADPRSPERGQYTFLQDLLQRVAYETLSRSDRRDRHLAAAEHLGTVLDGEAMEVVAAHYLDAVAAAPDAPDNPVVRAKAGDALVRAGARAASLGAHEEATRAFAQAADLAEDPAVRAELYERAGDAALTGSNHAAAREQFERAIDLYESAGLHHRAARQVGWLGWTMWIGGDLAGGAERIEQAAAALADEEFDSDLASLYEILGRVRYFRGDPAGAAEPIERALEIAEALVLPEVLVDALNTKHLLLGARGSFEEGFALLGHAVEIGRKHGVQRPLGRALYNLSYQQAARDRYGEAIAVDEEMLESARRRGDRLEEAMALGHLVTSYLAIGDWNRAEEIALGLNPESTMRASSDRSALVLIHCYRGETEAARAVYEDLKPGFDDAEIQMHASRLFTEGVLLYHEGDATGALERGRLGYDLALDAGLAYLHPLIKWNLRLALETAADLGDVRTIDELLGSAEARKQSERTPMVEALILEFRGRLHALAGDDPAAARMLADAVAIWRSLQLPLEEARTNLALGEMLARTAPDRAEEPLRRARAFYERVGAQPSVDRVERIAANARKQNVGA